MANSDHVSKIKLGSAAFNTWRIDNPKVKVDLSEADLTGANLSKMNLSSVNLRGARLCRAAPIRYKIDLSLDPPGTIPNVETGNEKLPGDWIKIYDKEIDGHGTQYCLPPTFILHCMKETATDLSDTDLSNADLSDVDLSNAIMRGAYLQGAILTTGILRYVDLSGANLDRATLDRTSLEEANLTGSSLVRATLKNANVKGATLQRADLSNAVLSGAILYKADLRGAYAPSVDLSQADLQEANLSRAQLDGGSLFKAKLQGANLKLANLVEARIEGASLDGCHAYGVSAWGMEGESVQGENLIITRDNEPIVTTDSLKVAQFVYLLLRNPDIRDVIDTVTSKIVLILGRFTEERKAVLDALRSELRHYNLAPVLFDFDIPADRDITETVTLLARMSRFIVADLTDPASIPMELQAIAPDVAVPIQSIVHKEQEAFSMFKTLRKYHWVLPPYYYSDIDELLADLQVKIITPAEDKRVFLKSEVM